MSTLRGEPPYTFPARHAVFDAEQRAESRRTFGRRRAQALAHPSGTLRRVGTSSILERDEDVLRDELEQLWERGGTDAVTAYTDVRTVREAANRVGDFVKEKIRGLVHDPATSERLTDMRYPFGSRRLVLEHGYYETFNLGHVELVDVRRDPVVEVTESGIRLQDREIPLDVIVCATGFDALTGALFAMKITGVGEAGLREAWGAGPRTALGLGVNRFPNLFIVAGPGTPSVLSNMVVCIEHNVEWITDLINHMRTHGYTRVEASDGFQEEWTTLIQDLAADSLLAKGRSWYVGANVPGKTRGFALYLGGFDRFRRLCAEHAGAGYPGFHLS